MNWAFSIPANSSKTSVSPTIVSVGEAYVRDLGCRLDAGRAHPLRMGTLEKGTFQLVSFPQHSDRFPGGLEVVTP